MRATNQTRQLDETGGVFGRPPNGKRTLRALDALLEGDEANSKRPLPFSRNPWTRILLEPQAFLLLNDHPARCRTLGIDLKSQGDGDCPTNAVNG